MISASLPAQRLVPEQLAEIQNSDPAEGWGAGSCLSEPTLTCRIVGFYWVLILDCSGE